MTGFWACHNVAREDTLISITFWRVQDKILLTLKFATGFEKEYMRVSGRVRTFSPLTLALSPLRGEGIAGGHHRRWFSVSEEFCPAPHSGTAQAAITGLHDRPQSILCRSRQGQQLWRARLNRHIRICTIWHDRP